MLSDAQYCYQTKLIQFHLIHLILSVEFSYQTTPNCKQEKKIIAAKLSGGPKFFFLNSNISGPNP